MYGTGSGPGSSVALQHGGASLAVGLPAGVLAHAHPIPAPAPPRALTFLAQRPSRMHINAAPSQSFWFESRFCGDTGLHWATNSFHLHQIAFPHFLWLDRMFQSSGTVSNSV